MVAPPRARGGGVEVAIRRAREPGRRVGGIRRRPRRRASGREREAERHARASRVRRTGPRALRRELCHLTCARRARGRAAPRATRGALGVQPDARAPVRVQPRLRRGLGDGRGPEPSPEPFSRRCFAAGRWIPGIAEAPERAECDHGPRAALNESSYGVVSEVVRGSPRSFGEGGEPAVHLRGGARQEELPSRARRRDVKQVDFVRIHLLPDAFPEPVVSLRDVPRAAPRDAADVHEIVPQQHGRVLEALHLVRRRQQEMRALVAFLVHAPTDHVVDNCRELRTEAGHDAELHLHIFVVRQLALMSQEPQAIARRALMRRVAQEGELLLRERRDVLVGNLEEVLLARVRRQAVHVHQLLQAQTLRAADDAQGRAGEAVDHFRGFEHRRVGAAEHDELAASLKPPRDVPSI